MAELKELAQLKAYMGDHFEVDDWQAVDLLMGVAAAHFVPGEMLWVYLVGASRSLKTEMLRAIGTHPCCTKAEHLTPAAIRGGLQKGPKWLSRVDGKLVLTKELAVLLTIKKETRTELSGLLRSVADGETVSDYGSDEGHLEQAARFDWIIATTRYVERERVWEDYLGTRFVVLRWGPPKHREAAAHQAGNNNPALDPLRGSLADHCTAVLSHAEAAAIPGLPDFVDSWWLASASNTLALLRTPVLRSRSDHMVEDIPDPELPTSIQQNFVRILGGLAALGIEDYKPYVRRLVRDGTPSVRLRVVLSLLNGKGVRETSRDQDLSLGLVERVMEDLRLLNVYRHPKFLIDTSTLQNGSPRDS